jgi:hypothetical protein
MTMGRMIELAVALALLAGAVWLYRRRAGSAGGYGSQSAVLLLVVALIIGIHALGGLDYHPTQTELDYFKAQRR